MQEDDRLLRRFGQSFLTASPCQQPAELDECLNLEGRSKLLRLKLVVSRYSRVQPFHSITTWPVQEKRNLFLLDAYAFGLSGGCVWR